MGHVGLLGLIVILLLDISVADDGELMKPLEQEIVQFRKELETELYQNYNKWRAKRSYGSRYTFDIKLDTGGNNFLEARVPSVFAYPFICNGKGYVIQGDGIYKFEGFTPEQHYYTENVTGPSLSKINGDWSIGLYDKVLHVMEWEQKCFVIVANQNRTFSSIYTLHGENLEPVFRQQIKNYGVATAAKFFSLKKNLYLVITNDNAVHSLTICPLFRWAGTYMDEIHAIQTRGAVAVETFTINSKEYIAIAQSQDSSGNFEVGTQILLIDEKEDLEKVQLLWSNGPVSLQYVPVFGQHYLIIGLSKESSICYVFAGIDFIQVQTLDGYFGPKLLMDTFELSDKGPALLATTSKSILFYTWSTLSESFVLNSNKSALTIRNTIEIDSAKFIRPSLSSQVFLTLIESGGSYSYPELNVYPMELLKKEIAESQIIETESKLSKCLIDIRKRLDEDGNVLPAIEKESERILTLQGDKDFRGKIVVTDALNINETVAELGSLDVVPEYYKDHDPLATPSILLSKLGNESDKLTETVIVPLKNVLMRNKIGQISGDYTFLNGLEFGQINAPTTNFELDSLNEKLMSDIKDFAMRKTDLDGIPQTITGSWIINKLTVNKVKVPSQISDVVVENFLRQTCLPSNEKVEVQIVQNLSNNVIFKKDVQFLNDIIMSPDATVNGITMSDVVLKNSPVKEIRGYKHATNLDGSAGFTFQFINDKNFPVWYDSVMHLNGPPQFPKGKKTFTAAKGNRFENLVPGTINGKNWKDFYTNVLRSIGDQTIEGSLNFERLEVDFLEADSVDGVKFSDLISTSEAQTILSNITVDKLTVHKDLQTININNSTLISSAVRKGENAEIQGPVELEGVALIGDVTLEDTIEIAGKDVSESAKLRRKQVYISPRSKFLVFRGPVEVTSLATPILNNHSWNDFKSNFWTQHSNNNIQGPLDLRGRKVEVTGDFTTRKLNNLDLETDLVKTDDGSPITAKLNFVGDVIFARDVIQLDGKTLNGFDFSEVSKNIVTVGDEGKTITGTKTFQSKIIASDGAEITTLNGVRIPNDLVFLNTGDEIQNVQGHKYFKGKTLIHTLQTDANVTVDGKVNGFDLIELNKTTAFKDRPVTIHGNVQFNASFRATVLNVTDKVNGLNSSELFSNIIFLNEYQFIKFPITIKNGNIKSVGPAKVTFINGVDVKDYLSKVVLSRDQAPVYRINGTKTFTNLRVNGDLACPTFNGISLTDLSEKAFSLFDPQNITGKFIFDKIIVDGNLDIGNDGGLKIEDLVFIDDPEACAVDGDVEFAGNVISEGPIKADGSLNGYPVKVNQKDGLPHEREFSEIEVEGNLDWDNNREDIRGISRLFENVVTLDTDQNITGKVTFADGFDADNVEAYPWINDINLEEMELDAVTDQDNPLELIGNNTFLKGLAVTDGELVVNDLEAERLNGINLRGLDKFIVRSDSVGIVQGTKHFINGLQLHELKFKDLDKKGNYNWLVLTDDNRTIDSIEFGGDLTVQHDFNYNHTKSFDLDKMLANRISKKEAQTISGNFTTPSLTVKDCNIIESINGIKLSDIVFKNETNKQVLDGKKTFEGGLDTTAEIETPEINGFNFKELYDDVYRLSKNETVTRPITFDDPVNIKESLEVENHINDYRLEDVKSSISKSIDDFESRAMVPSNISPTAESLVQINKLNGSTPPSTVWLDYLRLKQNWSSLGPQSRVEFTPTKNGGIIGLHEASNLNGQNWGEGCQCNNVRFVTIDGPSISTAEDDYFGCTNAFVVRISKDNIYSVEDRSLSYNNTCSNTEYSSLIVKRGHYKSNDIILNESSKGYLSDVKGFSVNGTDYLILAYFFDAKRQNHKSSTYVYKVAKSKLILVQNIASSGPVRLAMTDARGEWFLAVAHNRDPKTNSCLTNSAIYRWSSRPSPHFRLLSNVKTNGAVDVIFGEIEDIGLDYEDVLSFVAFAQSGNSGDGEVTILQYDKIKKNYFTLQSLRTKWSVTGLEYFCIEESCFLVIVVPQEGVHFYEYRYVEGFTLSLSVPIAGAKDIISFNWGQDNERAMFAIASEKTSLLTEAIIVGSSDPDRYESEDRYENIPYNLQF